MEKPLPEQPCYAVQIGFPKHTASQATHCSALCTAAHALQALPGAQFSSPASHCCRDEAGVTHKVPRPLPLPALPHSLVALCSPVLFYWQWKSLWQSFTWFVHVINYFTWQERGIHVHVAGIITMLICILIAVGFQLLVTSCLVLFFF